MNRLQETTQNRSRRKYRIRKVVVGTSSRPRLTVHISNSNVSCQIIDDSKHNTLASATTIGNKSIKGTLTEKAEFIGEQIAKQAKAKKIKKVVFDRNGRLFHGRIKALADKAREGGLEF